MEKFVVDSFREREGEVQNYRRFGYTSLYEGGIFGKEGDVSKLYRLLFLCENFTSDGGGLSGWFVLLLS